MFLPLFRNLPCCSRNVTHRLKPVVSSSVNKANFRLRTFCVSGKICQIQSDQAFETLGFASLRIYYWSRMKLAIFPWERKMQENSFKFSDPTPAVTMPNWKFGFQRGVTLQYRPHCGRGALDERKLRGASQRCIPHNPNLIL